MNIYTYSYVPLYKNHSINISLIQYSQLNKQIEAVNKPNTYSTNIQIYLRYTVN